MGNAAECHKLTCRAAMPLGGSPIGSRTQGKTYHFESCIQYSNPTSSVKRKAALFIPCEPFATRPSREAARCSISFTRRTLMPVRISSTQTPGHAAMSGRQRYEQEGGRKWSDICARQPVRARLGRRNRIARAKVSGLPNPPALVRAGRHAKSPPTSRPQGTPGSTSPWS